MSSHSVPIRHASTRSRPQSLFEAHPDLPPFKPPPIRTRLRPLIPFFIYWCIVTSLAVHLLRARISAREAATKSSAQISVLEGLIERYRAGEKVTEGEVRRELEMVGLRERQLDVGERSEVGREVGWMEAIFGRRKGNVEDSRGEELVAAAAAEEILGESVGEKKKREEEARQEKQELEEWARGECEITYAGLCQGTTGQGFGRKEVCGSGMSEDVGLWATPGRTIKLVRERRSHRSAQAGFYSISGPMNRQTHH